MAEWQGKARGGALGHRIFISLLKNFGFSPAYFLLRFVSIYFLIFSRGSFGHLMFYFRRIHGYGKWRSFVSIYRSFNQFGESLLDKIGAVAGVGKERFTFDFDGEEYLHRLAEEGKGAILMSAHIGNWDIAGHLLHRIKAPINVVMYDEEHQRIKEAQGDWYGKRSFNVIPIKDDLSHLISIKKALSKGEFICLHGDRFLEGGRTLEVELMGYQADLPYGPFLLASKFKVPTAFVFAMKDSSSHYHFYCYPPRNYSSMDGPKEEKVRRVADDLVEVLEEKIREYPEQWFNYYPFWEAQKKKEG